MGEEKRGRQRQGRRITVFDRERDEEREYYRRWFFDGAHRRTLRLFETTKTPAGTPALHLVSASLAIIYSCWRPSLVTMAKLSIHSGYLPGKRPPARGNHSSSPSPPPDRGKQTHAYEQTVHRWWRRIHSPPPCTGYTQHRHGVYTASYLAPRDCSSFLVNRPPPPFLLTIAVSFLFDRIPLPCQPRSTTTLLSFSPFVTDRGTERRIWIRFNLVLKGGERDRTMIFLLNERLKDRYRY